jgi:hypothetical protein
MHQSYFKKKININEEVNTRLVFKGWSIIVYKR